MKKLLIALITVLFLLILAGCTSTSYETEVITDRFFVRQISDIIRELDRWEGRSIQLDGSFRHINLPTGEVGYFVIRYASDGCCDIFTVGLEVCFNNLDIEPFQENAWVQAIGVLEVRDSWRQNQPTLVLTSIEELAAQGRLFVQP